MFKFIGIVFSVAVFTFAGVQGSPPLRICANIPFSGCRFGDLLSQCPSVCSYFFDAVETALVNDTSALYTLQRAFFPEGQQRPNVVDIYITLILEQAIELPCDSKLNDYRDRSIAELRRLDLSNICNGSNNCTRREYRWHHVWTSAVLTNVIERESLGLISSINTVAYVTRLYSESQTSVIITSQETDFQPRETAFLELNIPNLLCLPNNTEATLQGAWEDILPWIHGYTQKRGRIFFSDVNRAFIFEDGNIDPDSERIFGTFQRREVDTNVFVPYLTALHILLQVAIGLVIMKLTPSYYSNISQGKGGKTGKINSPSVSIFWANVFFASIIDVLFVSVDLYLIVSVYGGVDSAINEIITSNNRSSLETVFVFGMLGTLVTFILVGLQFFVAAGISKNTELYVPGVLRLLCCFFRCRHKKLGGEFWHKVLQTFAIWFLMVFLQLIAGSVIPYLVLAIVNPVPSVTFLALGASTLFCLIVFVASLIHVGVQVKKSSCYDKIVAVVQGLVFIVFLGLVAITVIIYQGVIQSGTSTGFVSGIALSLIPPSIIAVLGVAVKFKLLSDTDEDEDPEHQDESLFTRATSLIRHQLSTRRVKDKHRKDNARDSNSIAPSDHPETVNGAELKKPDISKESRDDDISNNEKSDHNHTLIKRNLSISEANLIEYNKDETDLGDGSGSEMKESGIKDPLPTNEVKGKPEPETDSGNDSSSDKKEPDLMELSTTNDTKSKLEPEFEAYVNEPAVEVVKIDFTDLDNEK